MILTKFSQVLRMSYPKFGKREIYNIQLLQNDPKWQEVVKAAKEAVQELKQRESK